MLFPAQSIGDDQLHPSFFWTAQPPWQKQLSVARTGFNVAVRAFVPEDYACRTFTEAAESEPVHTNQ